jgi:uncharacterized coiled-coil protein SlyX
MYYFVDESGNTGLNLFDANQPTLFYGVLGSKSNLDLTAKTLLHDIRQELGVSRIHANELGVGRLTQVADQLTRFSKKNDLRFSLFKVSKIDHAVLTFFDQVFDSGMNEAVPWSSYWTPLRFILLFKVAHLFDLELAKEAWAARREQNPVKCAEKLKSLCLELLSRVNQLPDKQSRELISGAFRWAAEYPDKINYGVGNYESSLQISPNLVGFQQVLAGIAHQSRALKSTVNRIVVDQQTEFNRAQAELADIYQKLRGHSQEMGPGMPKADFTNMPSVPPTFLPGNQSAGLELVDVSLWIAKRLEDNKPISEELRALIATQGRRGIVDEVSFAGLDRRWRHLQDLPEPDEADREKAMRFISQEEANRQEAIRGL